MNLNELVREIADQRGEIAEAAQNARKSFDKLGVLLLEELADAKIDNIPESAERKYLLYSFLVAYAQGPESLQIFAEEENIPYKVITNILDYLELKSHE